MNPTLLAKLKALNPTEGEWAVINEHHIRSFKEHGHSVPIAETYSSIDSELITLAPAMRQELLKMEEAYNIVKELAQWAKKYPRDKVHHVSETMDNELIALEEKAKQFINTNPTQP